MENDAQEPDVWAWMLAQRRGANHQQVSRNNLENQTARIVGVVIQRPREPWEGAHGPPIPSLEFAFTGLDNQGHFSLSRCAHLILG